MNGKFHKWLPYAFMVLAALSRWPGLFPPNFSAFYALAFCAGAFFPRNVRWWLPMATIMASDFCLNLYYGSFSVMQAFNYVAFGALIGFGTRFNPRSSFVKLLSGGIIGAVFFYLLTNTAAWLFNPYNNPEYTKDLAGWIIALTKGTAGYPPTLEFFFNTLISGGMFTGLFAGAMKMTAAEDPAPEPEAEEKPEEAEEAPEEAKA